MLISVASLYTSANNDEATSSGFWKRLPLLQALWTLLERWVYLCILVCLFDKGSDGFTRKESHRRGQLLLHRVLNISGRVLCLSCTILGIIQAIYRGKHLELTSHNSRYWNESTWKDLGIAFAGLNMLVEALVLGLLFIASVTNRRRNSFPKVSQSYLIVKRVLK